MNIELNKLTSPIIAATGYIIPNGQNLTEIFLPLQEGTLPLQMSNYYYYDSTINSYQDLSTIFAGYVGGVTAETTYYNYVNNTTNTFQDLNLLYQNINNPIQPFSATGTYIWSYDYVLQQYIITYFSNDTTQNSLTFNVNIGEINTICVGGGGAGGGSTGSQQCGAGGGGGGAILASTTTGYPVGDNINIYIGTGGIGGPVKGANGSSTTITNSTLSETLITCSGGGGGNIGNTGEIEEGGAPGYCTLLNNAFTNVSGSTGGIGGNGYNGLNYYGAPGASSALASYFYENNTYINTIYQYSLGCLSGGGGGGNDGNSSNGFAAYGGNGLGNLCGGLGGWTTNTNYPISDTNVSWGQNNMPSYGLSPTGPYNGFNFGSGGGGVGTLVKPCNGGSGRDGIVKFLFNYNYPPITNNYFNISGNTNYNSSYNNVYDGLTYYQLSCYSGTYTLTVNSVITSDIIMCGGGGGGGNGYYTSSSNFGAGSGGGGGGVAFVSSYTLQPGTYTIVVGNKGTSGLSGGLTSLSNFSGTIISCSGGGGGMTGSLSGGGAGGSAGNVTTTLSYQGGSGGSGGQGTIGSIGTTSANMSTAGSASVLTNSIDLPNGEFLFLGGGGGGGSQKYTGNGQTNPYGGSPGWGFGGLVGGNTISYNGQSLYNGGNAVFFGSGGGGGAAQPSPSSTTGGNGGDGLFLMYFFNSISLTQITQFSNLTFNVNVNGYNYSQQCIACSSNGQYVSVCGNGGVYVSNNSASSFTFITSPFSTYNNGYQGLNLFTISMNSTGQYQLATSSADGTTAACNIYVSNNYGVSWTTIMSNITTNNWGRWFQSSYVSSTGQYMIVGGGGGAGMQNYISTNYGVSFTISGYIYNRAGCSLIPLNSSMIAFSALGASSATPPGYSITPTSTLTEYTEKISSSYTNTCFRVTNDQSGEHIAMSTYYGWGSNVIYTTSNGQQVLAATGTTGSSTYWNTINSPSGYGINNICYTADGSLLVAITANSMLISKTYGDTWSTVNFNNVTNIFYSILSTNGNILYLIDQSSNLYSFNLS